MTPEHQEWVKITKVKDKTWIYDNVLNLIQHADMHDVITTVGKELGMRIPNTILTPHELYNWLDTYHLTRYWPTSL